MKISGVVFDNSDKSTLPGANINMVETNGVVSTFGTNTDENGKFEINSSSIEANTNFRISYIGFKSQIYSAAELQNKSIYLKEDAFNLPNLVINKDNSKPSLDINTSAGSKFVAAVKKNKTYILLITGVLAVTGSIFIIKKNM